MTTTRIRIARIAVPAAAALLALSACSSTTADSSTGGDEMIASPSAEMMESEAMESDAMESDAMESEAMESDAMEDDAAMMEQAGSFIDFATYESNKATYDQGAVVLFFNATWCPTCQETVKNLTEDAAEIPGGLTVVSVDYDTSDQLKQAYGVTTQHTFVQVDADGSELAKWTGSATAKDIAKKTV